MSEGSEKLLGKVCFLQRKTFCSQHDVKRDKRACPGSFSTSSLKFNRYQAMKPPPTLFFQMRHNRLRPSFVYPIAVLCLSVVTFVSFIMVAGFSLTLALAHPIAATGQAGPTAKVAGLSDLVQFTPA